MTTRCTLQVLVLAIASGCVQKATVLVTGQAGRDVHDPTARIVQEQFLIEYTIKNTSSSDVVFDRVAEMWSVMADQGGLSQTVLCQGGGQWTLQPGQAKSFVSGTDGYTLQLEDKAKGRPVTFSFSLLRGEQRIVGHFSTVLPKLRDLPPCSRDILVLKNRDTPLPKDLAKLPPQNLLALTFSQK